MPSSWCGIIYKRDLPPHPPASTSPLRPCAAAVFLCATSSHVMARTSIACCALRCVVGVCVFSSFSLLLLAEPNVSLLGMCIGISTEVSILRRLVAASPRRPPFLFFLAESLSSCVCVRRLDVFLKRQTEKRSSVFHRFLSAFPRGAQLLAASSCTLACASDHDVALAQNPKRIFSFFISLPEFFYLLWCQAPARLFSRSRGPCPPPEPVRF